MTRKGRPRRGCGPMSSTAKQARMIADQLRASGLESIDLGRLTNPTDQLRAQLAVARPLYESSLTRFLRQAWPIIEPGTEFVDNWHIQYLSEWLELVTEGVVRRLAVCEPPRHMKSDLGTVVWPCWEWTRQPELQYLTSSYAETLSKTHSRKRRRLLKSSWYTSLWPGTQIDPAMDQTSFFESTAGGHMIASSVTGFATGLGGNRVIIDDPMNPKQALSDAERERLNETVKNTLLTRLNDKKRDAIVLFMQRLNVDDTVAYLTGLDDSDLPEDQIVIKSGEWTIIRLPAIAEADTVVRFPKGGRPPFVWRKGQALWEAREGLAVLRQMRLDLGEEDFSAQYLQRPQPRGGAVFKHDWLSHIYYQPPARVPVEAVIQSWDMSFKDKEGSSRTVGQVWGRYKLENYLLDEVAGQWDFTTALAQVRMLKKRWPMSMPILIEDTANGPAIISTLKSEIAGILPVTPEGSKIARAKAVTPVFESGHVWLPDPARYDFVPEFVQELTRFRGLQSKTIKTDRVDAASQAISYLERTFGLRSLVEDDSPKKVLLASRR